MAIIDVKATPVAPKQVGPVSRLTKVKKGKMRVPLRCMFYGPHGVGKSTLAADAPDPIFFDIEEGSSTLDVARYSFRDDERSGHVPLSYGEIIAAIDDLTFNEHLYGTLVIDTVDRLESLIWRHMMERDSQTSAANPKSKSYTSIEDYGYGKGYIMAVEEWRAFCARLDRLRSQRRMNIVLIAHEQIRPFKNPEGEDYDRYQLRLNDKAAGFLKEWSDIAGFASYEETAAKVPGAKTDRPKGISTGRRILRFERTAAFDAKSRVPLPSEVEIAVEHPWAPLAAAIDAAFESEVAKLVGQIGVELARINDPDLGPKVNAATKEAADKADVAALVRYLTELQKRHAKEAA